MTKQDIKDERREYLASALNESDLQADPLPLFEDWLASARGLAKDATAMTLATATSDGWPSVRTVLLKDYGEQGFVWFTDTHSQKGQELAENPKAEIQFYWHALERQVRIQGHVTAVDPATSDAYFAQRPLGSRLSAAASHQSAPVDNRQVLEAAVHALAKQYSNGDVPRPERWGGYCLTPIKIEFWQGRESRLHDRFIYTRESVNEPWTIQRIQP